MNKTILRVHLVLNFHWYTETTEGGKRIEYRKMSPHWEKLIWERRDSITHVRFSKGYTSEVTTYKVDKIDIGKCPIEGWDGEYYRIHFNDNELWMI